jgi:hypothetical protein
VQTRWTRLRFTLWLAFCGVTLFAFAQGAEHAAAAARAVAADNARAGPVLISGATGPKAAAVNGFYTVTEEKSSDGRFVLSKRGDPSMCIEHRGGQWEVKEVSSKGKALCKAYVAGGCALEECASRVWRVDTGDGFVDQPSVKLATGAEVDAAEAHATVVRVSTHSPCCACRVFTFARRCRVSATTRKRCSRNGTRCGLRLPAAS